MKKTYINPTLEVFEININTQLLTVSAPVLGGEYNSDTDGVPLAPEFGDDGFVFAE